MSQTGTNAGHDLDAGDQDAEPTMNAPEQGRPDGLDALKPDESSADAAPRPEQPERTDAEVMEAEEEQRPFTD